MKSNCYSQQSSRGEHRISVISSSIRTPFYIQQGHLPSPTHPTNNSDSTKCRQVVQSRWKNALTINNSMLCRVQGFWISGTQISAPFYINHCDFGIILLTKLGGFMLHLWMEELLHTVERNLWHQFSKKIFLAMRNRADFVESNKVETNCDVLNSWEGI